MAFLPAVAGSEVRCQFVPLDELQGDTSSLVHDSSTRLALIDRVVFSLTSCGKSVSSSKLHYQTGNQAKAEREMQVHEAQERRRTEVEKEKEG